MRTIKIINLTPHDIVLLDPHTLQAIHTFPASTEPPRCPPRTETEEVVQLEDSKVLVSLTHTRYEKAITMPEPQPYTLFIVSDIIAQNLSKVRDDLRIPNGLIRDPKTKKILGCKSLGRI